MLRPTATKQHFHTTRPCLPNSYLTPITPLVLHLFVGVYARKHTSMHTHIDVPDQVMVRGQFSFHHEGLGWHSGRQAQWHLYPLSHFTKPTIFSFLLLTILYIIL